jgi:hypothetical protein
MMMPNMENPALAGTGLPNSDLLTGWIVSESKPSLVDLQAVSLTRRCAITAAMAAVVAPLVFGERG